MAILQVSSNILVLLITTNLFDEMEKSHTKPVGKFGASNFFL